MDPTAVYTADLPGREFLQASYDFSTKSWQLEAIVSPATLQLIRNLKATGTALEQWPVPQGRSSGEMLLRELLLKVKGLWQFPLQEPELCHCRAVTTEKVDQAIMAGAHSVEKIRRWTSANGACGTCLPEVQKLLHFRLTPP